MFFSLRGTDKTTVVVGVVCVLGPLPIPPILTALFTFPTESNISLFPSSSILLHQPPPRQTPTTHHLALAICFQAVLTTHELPFTQFRAIYFAVASSRNHITHPSILPSRLLVAKAPLHSCGAFIPTIQFSWGS